MAHSALHFSLGMAAGSALAMVPLIRTWRRGGRLAGPFARWLVLAYGLGLCATVPGWLRRMGVPDGVCDGWWMNVFLFYPLVNRLKSGGMLPGFAFISACFSLQYAILLVAIARGLSRKTDTSGPNQPTPGRGRLQ